MQQQNIVMISKAWDKVHLEENISIFDFELSDEEMKGIGMLDETTRESTFREKYDGNE